MWISAKFFYLLQQPKSKKGKQKAWSIGYPAGSVASEIRINVTMIQESGA